MFWDQRFAEPILLPDGAKLATLRDAVAHLGKPVSKGERDLPVVLTAAELWKNAAEHGGPIEFARNGRRQRQKMRYRFSGNAAAISMA